MIVTNTYSYQLYMYLFLITSAAVPAMETLSPYSLFNSFKISGERFQMIRGACSFVARLRSIPFPIIPKPTNPIVCAIFIFTDSVCPIFSIFFMITFSIYNPQDFYEEVCFSSFVASVTTTITITITA